MAAMASVTEERLWPFEMEINIKKKIKKKKKKLLVHLQLSSMILRQISCTCAEECCHEFWWILFQIVEESRAASVSGHFSCVHSYILLV